MVLLSWGMMVCLLWCVSAAPPFGDRSLKSLVLDFTSAESLRGKALHHALRNEDELAVKFLLGRSASFTMSNGSTALHIAALRNARIAQLVLAKLHGSLIDAKNNAGQTPLHYAACNPNPDVATLLVRNGADTCALDAENRSPLEYAIHYRCIDTAMTLLSHGVNLSRDELSRLLLMAVRLGHLPLVSALLDRGANFQAVDALSHQTALHVAASLGRCDIIDVLVLTRPWHIEWTIRTVGHNHSWLLESLFDIDWLNQNVDPDHECSWPNRCQYLYKRDDSRRTALDIAAAHGHVDAVRALVEKHHMDPNPTSIALWKYRTPLYYATVGGHKDTVDLLVSEYKVCPIVNGHRVKNFLHCAAEYGHTHIIRHFHETCGADLTTLDYDGWTLLHHAASKGHAVTVQYLCQHISVNAPAHNKYTPLSLAATKGHTDTLRILLKELHSAVHGHPAQINPHDNLHASTWCAVEMGHVDALRLLLPYCPDVNAQDISGKTLLYCAAEKGHNHVIKLLVEQYSANVNLCNCKFITPLVIAVRHGHESTAQLLLERYHAVREHSMHTAIAIKALDIARMLLMHMDAAEHESLNWTPLHRIAYYGEQYSIAISSEMVHARDKLFCTPLHYAAYRGNEHIVSVLLEAGADPNAQDCQGMTSLHVAAKAGHLSIVTSLLNYGVEINATDYLKCPPLDYAIHCVHPKVVNLLIERGANVAACIKYSMLQCIVSTNNANFIGRFVRPIAGLPTKTLHFAAKRGLVDAIHVLKKRIPVNAHDTLGQTAAHYAASNNQCEAIGALAAGLNGLQRADLLAKDKNGMTPFALAARAGHIEAMQCIMGLTNIPILELITGESRPRAV